MHYVVLVAHDWLGKLQILLGWALDEGPKLVSVLGLPVGWWGDAPAVASRVPLVVGLSARQGLPSITEFLFKFGILT